MGTRAETRVRTSNKLFGYKKKSPVDGIRPDFFVSLSLVSFNKVNRIKRRKVFSWLLFLTGAVAVWGCASQRKVSRLGNASVEITLPKEADFLPDQVSGIHFEHSDTIFVKGEDGRDLILLKAVKDESTGEMVATDVLDAAIVTARFRNKAERNGKVDIEFQIHVPQSMMDRKWEMTLHPRMYILGETVDLDPVLVTGHDFRSRQLRGYERYQRFLDSIETDSTVFVNHFLLERFLERNIPQVYRFRNDTSLVSDEEFAACYGVTEQEAVRHYTRQFQRTLNDRKVASKGEKFRRMVKVPVRTEGIRLDTIWKESDGDFVYNYVHTVVTRPQLRKIDVTISGEIHEQEKRLYSIPVSDTLTFYISTLSAFVHDIVRYKTEIVYRRAEANASYSIQFPVGRNEIRTDLGNNAAEIARIKEHLQHLIRNDTFDLDSIIVTANSSPEGAWSVNARLSEGRAGSVSRFFERYMEGVRDSLSLEKGFSVDTEGTIHREQIGRVRFRSRSRPENWEELDRLVAESDRLDGNDRDRYSRLRETRDPDRREWLLHGESFYPYLRDSLYPLLRTVSFDFHMHRKGMVKDTVQTTVVDDVYQDGIQAIRDRDFERAVTLLAPYKDYNTAVAYLAMDRNYNALEILERQPRSPEVYYMMAILKSRLGDIQDAVQCYMAACEADRVYVSRGNLDPEISTLIRMYGLNEQDEEDDWIE